MTRCCRKSICRRWSRSRSKARSNDDVQGFMVKPPGFDPAKKYPLKFLIHGGPQGAWGNSWSYRWNAELFAANGYVVVMINFHGSTGYGQKFTDSISGDWGGKPYVDLMKGLDYVEKTYPFIDKNREAALGASYGGYMANWVLGHTDRFKCIVSHDGVFNTESAYGTTEELWFKRVGIQRSAVEEPRALPEILAALVRRQIQNADARRAWPARLPAGCFRGASSSSPRSKGSRCRRRCYTFRTKVTGC